MKVSRPSTIAAVWLCCVGMAAATQKSESDSFAITVAGDLLGPYEPRTDPQLAEVLQLFKDADAGFANREGNVFDSHVFKAVPAAENDMSTPFDLVEEGPFYTPAAAKQLKDAGIGMVSLANNHATDFGLDGLAETERILDQLGIVHAGSGPSGAAARAAAFLETPKGRVALIATASTFTPISAAGPFDGKWAPRPGISALRIRPIVLVTEDEMKPLRVIATRQGQTLPPDAKELTLEPNGATIARLTFRAAEHPGLTYEVKPSDRGEILKAITAGKQSADFAVFSIHAHETESGGRDWTADPNTLAPADFLRPLFHEAIDAGADLVINHGPHALRGIEIYRGKPIFYGVGDLFFEGADYLPALMSDAVVIANKFQNNHLIEVRVYPIDIGGGPPSLPRPPSERGIPRRAHGENARRILNRLQRASAPYGTSIRIENDMGVIEVPQRHSPT